MFNDDFWGNDDDADSAEDLVNAYLDVRKGLSNRFFDEEDYEVIIDYFRDNNQDAESLEACEVALSFFPNSPFLLIAKAEILYSAQKYGQALHVLDLIETVDSLFLPGILLRADVYVAEMKYEAAAQLLNDMAEMFSSDAKVSIWMRLADVYDEAEDYEAVFRTLKKVCEYDPEDEFALRRISFWTDLTGMHDESIVLHKKLLDYDPFNALAWFNLGAAHQGKKEFKEAIEAYEYCVAIDDTFEFAYRNMADAYMRLNWYEKAIESLERNLELGKPEDVIFEAMGQCFEKQKKFEKARHFYRKAIALSPTDDTIFFRIGETYFREQQWEKAAKAYSTALKMDKENANYFHALGKCLIELGSYHEALICNLNALRLKPHNKTNWLAFLKSLFYSEHYEEALLQLDNAEVMLGAKADFDYYHAGILLAMGKTKEAMYFLEKALSEAPRKLKLLIELHPDLLKRTSVANLVAQYKKKK